MTESLPTIEYVSEAGARWRERYERVDEKPWKVERHVDRWDADAEEWQAAGGEVLRELSINGMPRSASEIAVQSHVPAGDQR